MKRSATLKIQNGMVTYTQNANRQCEAASWCPSRYGQNGEAAALNEISPGKVLEEIAHEGVHEFMMVIPHAKLRCATGVWVAPPGDRLSRVTG